MVLSLTWAGSLDSWEAVKGCLRAGAASTWSTRYSFYVPGLHSARCTPPSPPSLTRGQWLLGIRQIVVTEELNGKKSWVRLGVIKYLFNVMVLRNIFFSITLGISGEHRLVACIHSSIGVSSGMATL